MSSRPETQNPAYKFSDGGLQFTANAFPARSLMRSNRVDGAWIVAYKEDTKRHFEAVVSTQRFHDNEVYEMSEKKKVPERHILKNDSYMPTEAAPGVRLLDGFYLMQLCCIEDPSDVSTLNINGRDLNHIKEEDMVLFDNVVEIYANENNLNFDGFKTFPNLKILSLSCNNLKTIHLRHEDFKKLEELDLSYNHLNPNDIAHLGVLQNIKVLKLSGNNLVYLPDTFSKSYVSTNEKNEKIVAEKFPKLEELHLDHNNLTEESSFDVLAILKKLKRLYLNNNRITSIPYLKIVGQDHVIQEFTKNYYKNKRNKPTNDDKKAKNETYLLHDPKIRDNVSANVKMAADLDLHKGNTLRNSFILEEDEELEDPNLSNEAEASKRIQSATENSEKTISLPFSELTYVNLAHNLLEEEESLIAIASWPMLNEVVLYGNPIISKNVGFPPLMQQFLIDRLGIKIQKKKELKPLKVPVNIPIKEHRVVDTAVTKVPKVPLEVRMMLTYPDQNIEKVLSNSDRSYTETQNESTKDSIDKTNISSSKKSNSQKEDFNTFFMTQVDNDVTEENENQETSKSTSGNQQIPSQEAQETKTNMDGFDLLFDIENEDQIKVPKDMGSCVRALRNILDHPLVFRDACLELDKPQKPYNPKPKKKSHILEQPPKLKTRLEEVSNIIDEIRNRNYVEEKSLTSALNSKNKKDYELAKKLLGEVQNKYNEVRVESLRQNYSPKAAVSETLKELEMFKGGFNKKHKK